jgi:uroporphyrin-III C-methyltransferase
MGLANIDRILSELIAAGLPAETPVAAISNGTTERERVCVGTLADIRARIDAADLAPPMLTVIGRVVGLAEGLTCISDMAAVADTVRHDAGA